MTNRPSTRRPRITMIAVDPTVTTVDLHPIGSSVAIVIHPTMLPRARELWPRLPIEHRRDVAMLADRLEWNAANHDPAR